MRKEERDGMKGVSEEGSEGGRQGGNEGSEGWRE